VPKYKHLEQNDRVLKWLNKIDWLNKNIVKFSIREFWIWAYKKKIHEVTNNWRNKYGNDAESPNNLIYF
jgi:hypothetical protein